MKGGGEMDQLRVKRKTLEEMLEQCYRALELLRSSGGLDVEDGDTEGDVQEGVEAVAETSSAQCDDSETAKLHDLLKSGLESPMFLERLGSIHIAVPHSNCADEGSSWDLVGENDLWDGGNIGEGTGSDQESYVLVSQEDIIEGVACFTAAYLLSLKQAKDLTPNQLQEALSKTFSIKKKKGKLQKAWEGGKVIYNVASWGATAIGIYQNPTLFRAASVAFWTSCRVISKLF